MGGSRGLRLFSHGGEPETPTFDLAFDVGAADG